MIHTTTFPYKPSEHEAERASNSYLMSVVALVVGLPLPIVNLVATLLFYLGNRKATYFVRWHCTQALLSQATMVLTNSVGVWWTISNVLGSTEFNNSYFAYIITILIFNVIEFAITLYSAIQVRKGIHVEWWFYGTLTNEICKPKENHSIFTPLTSTTK